MESKSKSFVISTADSKYVKPLLQKIIEANAGKGWRETLYKEKYDMKWCSASTEDEDWNQLINRYPGIMGLVYKDAYIRTMRIGELIDPDLFSFVPQQFSFPQDADKFAIYQKSRPGCIFIAKPSASSEGNGIVLFQQLSEIPTMQAQDMVVQRYIHDPLLVDGYKFDLRIYVMITRTNPLQAFICDEGLARFCTPTKKNFKNFFMHLTNYSINKHHEEYTESEDILAPNNATKRTLTSLFLTLQQQGYDIDIIKANIKQTCERTLSVYGPIIEHAMATVTNNKPVAGKFFQVLGFDLLIDEKLEAHLLEINDHPSLNILLEKDYMGGGCGKSLSTIDLYVKQRIISDSIKLARKSTESISQTDTFRSLSRIAPSTDPRIMEVATVINQVKDLYYKIAPVKQKATITSSNFEKLHQISTLIKESGITKIDLNLLFQKHYQGMKSVDFQQFFWLIVNLKQMLETRATINPQDNIREYVLRMRYSQSYQEQPQEMVQSHDGERGLIGEKLKSVIRKIKNKLNPDHEEGKKDWNDQMIVINNITQIQIIITSTSDETQWSQTLGWDPKIPNSVLEYSDLPEDINYTVDDDENHVNNAELQTVPDQIQLKYDWSYGDHTDFWEWFWRWYKLESMESKANYDKNQTLGVDQVARIITSRSQSNTSRSLFTQTLQIQIDDRTNKLEWVFLDGSQEGGLTANQSGSSGGKKCPDGYFTNSQKKCQSCATGCEKCSKIDMCSKCEKDWTLIKGETFGHCFPECPAGYFIQTCYTDDSKFFAKTSSNGKRTTSFNPTVMISQCETCPWGCGTCLFDQYAMKPFCYSCMKGFTLNQTSGLCEVTPCTDGQFRPKPLNKTVNITVDSNYDDYLCKNCENGCKNCSTATNCTQCFDGFAIFSRKTGRTQGCMSCPDYCKVCNITTSNTTSCVTCQDRFFLNSQKKCELNRTCAAGQWFNDSSLQCQSCPANCPTCQQGSTNGTVVCTSCTNDTFMDNTTKLCKDRCNYTASFYRTSNNTCQSCPNTTFPNNTAQQCQACPAHCNNCYWNRTLSRPECLTCTNTSSFERSTRRCIINCTQTMYFDYDTGICRNCPVGSFMNFTNRTCQKCPTNCTECFFNLTSSRTECTACVTNQTVDWTEKKCRRQCNATLFFNWTSGQCQACPTGTVINEITQTCQACPRGCTACFNNKTSNRVECSNCTTGMVIDATVKQCRDQCQSGQQFYWDAFKCRVCPPYQFMNSTSKNCSNCPRGCVDCYQANKSLYCSTCNDTTIFDFSRWQCKLDCKDDTVFNWDTFTCEKCPSGQFFEAFAKVCRNCSTNCVKCVQPNWYSTNTECQQCSTGYLVDQKRKVCVAECPTNQYWSSTSQKCLSCADGTFYNSSSQLCEACPSNCSKCYRNQLGQVKCYECKTGVLDFKREECRPVCNSAQYYNWDINSCENCPIETFYNSSTQECQSCPANCSSCFFNTGTNKTECNGCKNNWILDSTEKQCRQECPANQQYSFELKACRSCPSGQYSSSSNQCTNCPTHCSSCSLVNRNLQCQTCNSSAYLDTSRNLCRGYCNDTAYYDWTNHRCINCNSDQYLDSTTDKCVTCPSNCASCFYQSSTKTVKCTSCKSGFVYDNDRAQCRVQCNSTSYFDWNTNTCRQCSAGTFLNSAQQCQNCPNGCSQCAMSSTGQVQCSQCQDTFVFDSARSLCRPSCNSTSVYNWDTLSCQQCSSNSYVDNNYCVSCPTNCTACRKNSDNSIECTSCSSGSIIDASTRQCRPNCNSNQFWNNTARQCQSCSTGTWLNTETQSCQTCPIGCNACSGNSSNLPECSGCIGGFTLDSTYKRCRKNCASNQYFDWTLFECQNCQQANCVACTNASFCSSCSEQFNAVNGQCVDKCTSTQVWNSSTKKCDELVQASFRITSSSTNMIRCRNYTVTLGTFTGWTNQQFTSVKWNYTVSLGNNGNWRAQMNSIVNTASQANSQSISIPNTLTEQINSQTTITVTVQMTNSIGQTAKNSTTFNLWHYQFTQITNYNTAYTVDAAVGLKLSPRFQYPECSNPGPFAIPTGVDIGCKLYDSNVNYIKDLPGCQIKANEITNGNSYQIRYNYVPHPYQSALRDTITISTVVVQPSCSIAGNGFISVRSNETIQLSVTITNGKSSFVYRWVCQTRSANGVCGIQQTTQNSPNLNIPASGFTAGEQYDFTLIVIDNQVNQTTCATRVEIVSANPINLSLKLSGLPFTSFAAVGSILTSSTSSESSTALLSEDDQDENYVDPSINNNFICDQNGTSHTNLNYSIKVYEKSSSKSSLMTKDGIKSSKNALSILKNTLKQNSEYEVVCEATNGVTKGTVAQIFNTKQDLDIDLDFTIEPSQGTEYVTSFSLSVTKPADQNLWCRFAYQVGNKTDYIEQDEQASYSNSKQQVITILKRQSSSGTQPIKVICMNQNGQKAESSQNITLKRGSVIRLSSLSKLLKFVQSDKISFEDIQTSFNLYTQQLVNDLPRAEKQDFQKSILKQIELIAKNITAQQMQETMHIITDIWNQIKNDHDPATSGDLVAQVIATCNAVLDEEVTLVSVIKTFDQDHYLTIISIYNEILNTYSYVFNKRQGLMDGIVNSIEVGVVRISGNMLPDQNPFIAQGNHFVIQVEKYSKNEIKDGTKTENLTLSNDEQGVSISIPKNLILSQYDYTVITTVVLRKGLKVFDSNENIMSDTLQIRTYFANEPLAINNKWDVSPIIVTDLVDPVFILIPYKPNSDADNIDQMRCSFFNEGKKVWEKLECDINNHQAFFENIGDSEQMIACCSYHLDTFAIVYDTYYSELLEQAFRQILLSIVPPAFIYLILAISIGMTAYQSRKLRLMQEKNERQQTNQRRNVAVQDQESNNRDRSIIKSTTNNNMIPQFEVTSSQRRQMAGSQIGNLPVAVESNFTQNDISPDQELNNLDDYKVVDHTQIEMQPKEQAVVQQPKPESEMIKLIKSSSKIYKLFGETLQNRNEVFKTIFGKVMICNILLLSFTTSIIISYNVRLLTLTVIQATDLAVIIVGSYVILLMLSILFKQLESVIKNSIAIKHIWFALHLIFAFVQPIFLTQIADNLNREHFIKWAIASTSILAISCTLEDLLLVPIYHLASKALLTRFKA